MSLFAITTCHTLRLCLPSNRGTSDAFCSTDPEANIASVRCGRFQQCSGVLSSWCVYNDWRRTAVCNKWILISSVRLYSVILMPFIHKLSANTFRKPNINLSVWSVRGPSHGFNCMSTYNRFSLIVKTDLLLINLSLNSEFRWANVKKWQIHVYKLSISDFYAVLPTWSY